jgi:hypothetical protein
MVMQAGRSTEKETNMTLFAIDTDNTITTFAAAEQIPEGHERFTSEKELFAAATLWPTDRLVAIWNSFAGVAGFGADLKPVKKFTNRAVAAKRIWSAIQGLNGKPAAEDSTDAATPMKAPKAAKGAKKAAKAAPAKAKASKATKPAKKATAATPPREFSKKAIVIDMLKRKGGATMAEIAKETDWQNHTIRGFMAGAMKKAGYTIESSKNEAGERTYKMAK